MRSFCSPRALPLLLSLAAVSVAASVQKPLMTDSTGAQHSFLPSLADVLTTDRRLSIFYDYLRDVPTVNERLSSPLLHTTLLVPLNSAIVALPRKPHQSPPTSPSLPDASLSIAQQDSLKSSNVKTFIQAHTIPESIDLTSTVPIGYPTLLRGLDLAFFPPKQQGGSWTVWQDLNVVGVLEASNGRVLVLDGVIEEQEAVE